MVLFSPPFREISMFTRPGARWNEDAVGGGGSFLYVLDGATSLDAAPVMDPVSDAAWLVRETARWLDRHLPEASRPLEDILAQGMARLLDQWSGPRAALPSAGVAIFRRRGEGVEYFGLGDCAASLQLTDGTFRTWEETALSALDGQALEEACALAQARGAPSGRACRGSRPPSAATGPCGTPRGLLDPGPHRGGDLPRPPGDGPPEPVPVSLPVHRWAGPVRGLRPGGGRGRPPSPGGRGGMAPLADRLWACQAADPDLEALPRFKRRDDATGALCQVG